MSRQNSNDPHDARPDGGFVVIEWALGMVVLMLAALVVLGSIPRWAEQQATVRAAASEGARAALLVDDPALVTEVATVRAREVARNYGHDPADVVVDVTGEFAPGESITVTVTITTAGIRFPFGPEIGNVPMSASSVERVGDYQAIGTS